MMPLSTRAVLNLWLFSKIGTPKQVKPIGGDSDFAVDAQATMILAAMRVESIDGCCPPLLRLWLDGSGVEQEAAMLACVEFSDALRESLHEAPIYPVERGDEGVIDVPSYTLREIGEELGGLHPQAVKRFMDQDGFMLPGVFKFCNHWKILSIDGLKRGYEQSRTEVSAEALNWFWWTSAVRLILLLGPAYRHRSSRKDFIETYNKTKEGILI